MLVCSQLCLVLLLTPAMWLFDGLPRAQLLSPSRLSACHMPIPLLMGVQDLQHPGVCGPGHRDSDAGGILSGAGEAPLPHLPQQMGVPRECACGTPVPTGSGHMHRLLVLCLCPTYSACFLYGWRSAEPV